MATELNQEDGIFPWHSTEYVRTLNRNASTDADAAFYNPAGLAMLDKTGWYINFSNSAMHKKRTHTLDYYAISVSGDKDAALNGGPYDNDGETTTANQSDDFITNMPMGDIDDPTSRYAELFTPAMPDINLIYKADKWAAFFSVGIMQAAPKFTFGRGLATTDFGIMNVAETLNAVSNQTTDGSELLSLTWETNQIVRTEYYVAGTVGFAYRIIDMLSASAAVRYIYYYGNQKLEITGVNAEFDSYSSDIATLNVLRALAFLKALDTNIPQMLWDTANTNDWDVDTSYSGQSYGLILGTDFRPFNSLNIGVRYEYYLPALLKKKTNSFKVNSLIEATGLLNIFKDGKANPDYNNGEGYAAGNGSSTLKVTYPQSISVGISWQVLKSLRLEADGDVYFKNKVDLDGAEKDFNTAYRAGACVEYSLYDNMVLSLGYSYNNTGVKPETRTEIDPLLFNHTVGTGIGIDVNDKLTFNFGMCYIYYVSAKVSGTQDTSTVTDVYDGTATITTDSTSYFSKEFAETTYMISFGFTYRLGGGDSSAEADKKDDAKTGKKEKKDKKKDSKKKDEKKKTK